MMPPFSLRPFPPLGGDHEGEPMGDIEAMEEEDDERSNPAGPDTVPGAIVGEEGTDAGEDISFSFLKANKT